jgi:hypothetical protein
MRWSSSRAALAAAAALARGACVTQRTVYFEAPAAGRRLTTAEARAQLAALVGAECGRLAGSRAAAGEARFAVAVDSTLAVTRATLERPTGDERLDAELGTGAAALRLDAPGSRLRVAYACGGGGSAGPSATLEVR